MTLVRIARELSQAVGVLRFGPPVAYVYNPLDYAWEPHARYLRRYGKPPREVILVGMNPGPWGMAQTGVPFGEVKLVREWLGIKGRVEKPPREHPKRPVLGFACPRSEVSGQRLWGWARRRFGTPEPFFARFFVYNYCPLLFLEAGGRNLTPDRLPARDREALFVACDEALVQAVNDLRPRYVVGVGRFAEGRAKGLFRDRNVIVGTIPHPSPASPAANRGWGREVTRKLRALGIEV